VPEQLLNATRKLDDDEFSIIRLHPGWGAEVARKAQMSPTVVNIIRHHHENYDGSGYPGNLKGVAIPIESRIVAIADVYDAMTSERPYHKPYSAEVARESLRKLSGTRLDPHLVEIFLSIPGNRVPQ
jgi:HD-GYP domain-containing protein (c-di-GMP phosphodiesterase class II)